MKRISLILLPSLLLASPVMAADPLAGSLVSAWQDTMKATGNLQNGLTALLQDRAMLQAQLADAVKRLDKCGAPCAADEAKPTEPAPTEVKPDVVPPVK